MPRAGLELAIPATKQPQTASGRVATGIGSLLLLPTLIQTAICEYTLAELPYLRLNQYLPTFRGNILPSS
jgi:hypothetical protein